MNARVFTLDEAREILPTMRTIVKELRELRSEIVENRRKIELLETLWGREVRVEENPDAEEYRALKTDNRERVQRFRTLSEDLDSRGCQVKDLEQGIVGFFHERDGHAVFMAWDLDSDDVVSYDDIAPYASLFTLDGARKMLPRLHELFTEFDRINEGVSTARHELTLLETLWAGEGIEGDPSNPDSEQARLLRDQIHTLVHEARDLEGELHRSGCQLRDIRQGLIDFYHIRGGQLVLLCWRREETDIVAWHPFDQGFTSRKPLDDDGS
jgi:hypothetical protein